ncbi:MAG: hypothetical protein CMJ37_04200 [Phycisphaerae bacterium]|nr:hypothetical protein [Phycisphaerae bacterium]
MKIYSLFTGICLSIPAFGETVVVTQNGLDYLPADIRVKVGDTVRWEWTNGNHDVACGANCVEDGIFYGLLNESNPVFEYVVEESLAGQTVEYHCTVANHCGFGMVGFLVVDGATTPCLGDINGDQSVTFDDVLELLAAWGDIDPDKDIDGSGAVDFGDLVSTLANWGPC